MASILITSNVVYKADDPLHPLHARIQPMLEQSKHLEDETAHAPRYKENKLEQNDQVQETREEVQKEANSNENVKWFKDKRLGDGEYKALNLVGNEQ